MSRIDKVVPGAGNFRAPLAANFAYTASKPDYAHANLNTVLCVSLNASGQVVFATPNTSLTGLVGIIVLGEPKAAGQVVDVIQVGEVVEFTLANGSAAASGTTYASTVTADGTWASQAPGVVANRGVIGWTVEADRLVVRVTPGARAA